MMKYIGPLVSLLLLFGAQGLPAAEGEGGGAGSYFRLGVGARALAMGKAFSAVADDPSAAFWNPAGLTQYKGINVYSQLAFLSYERAHSYFCYSHAVVEEVTMAFSWLSFSGGKELEQRDGPSLEPISYFSDGENSYCLSLGYCSLPHIRVGANCKVLNHSLGEYSGWGFGFDLGVLASYRILRGALVVRDVGSRVNWKNAWQDEVPMTLVLGGALYLAEKKIVVSMEATRTGGQSVRPHAGMEYRPWPLLAVEGGYDDGTLCGGVTIGVNTEWADYRLAYTISGEKMVGAGNNHRLSFHMKFNAFDYYLWK